MEETVVLPLNCAPTETGEPRPRRNTEDEFTYRYGNLAIGTCRGLAAQCESHFSLVLNRPS